MANPSPCSTSALYLISRARGRCRTSRLRSFRAAPISGTAVSERRPALTSAIQIAASARSTAAGSSCCPVSTVRATTPCSLRRLSSVPSTSSSSPKIIGTGKDDANSRWGSASVKAEKIPPGPDVV